MQKYYTIAIALIFAVLLSGSYIDNCTAATMSETDSNTQNLSNDINESPLNILSVQNTVNNIITIIITGIVKTCTSGDPFEGVTITLKSLSGEILGSTTTDENGLYQIVFQYTEETLQSLGTTFEVTASYPGHIPSTKEVTVTPTETTNTDNTVDSNLYGNVNFQLGTLMLTKGSWDGLGVDSNKPKNEGPQEGLIQIHITNNATTTATNVWANLTLLAGNETWFWLKPGENATKFIGNLSPGQTVDLWYQIMMNNSTAPAQNNYETRKYTINVWEGNNPTNNQTINGTLERLGYQSQERNSVINIQFLNTTPIRTGDIFQILVTSTTASDYDNLIIPLANYDPKLIQPINYTVNWLNGTVNSTSKDLVLHKPGKSTFYSLWTFVALNPGITKLTPFIDDVSGASSHYNSQSSVTFTRILNITPKVDVASTKTVFNLNRPGETIQYNDLISYIIKISNYGPDNATGVNYTDLLPTGLIYFNHTISTDWGASWTANSTAYNPTNGIWNIGNITANSINQFILNITARVNAGGVITNNANKTGLNEFDSNVSNDNSTVTIRVPRADVYSDKSVSNLNRPESEFMYNDLILYNIGISNAGPNNATGVVYQDLLPEGLIYINHTVSTDGGASWTANSTAYNPIDGIWNIGNITAFTVNQFKLQITAQINTTGFITNNINKTAMTELDTNPANDNDTVTIYVPKADVASTKTVSNLNRPGETIQYNDLISYIIKISNYGNDPATGVVYQDLLPEGLIYC